MDTLIGKGKKIKQRRIEIYFVMAKFKVTLEIIEVVLRFKGKCYCTYF